LRSCIVRDRRIPCMFDLVLCWHLAWAISSIVSWRADRRMELVVKPTFSCGRDNIHRACLAPPAL
jgi:hypothetical protein